MTPRALRTGGLAVVSAAVLAGCGSGSPSTHTATQTTTVTRTSAAATTASTASTSSAPRAPRARTAGAAPGCTPSHTAVSLAPGLGATGHVGITIRFRNSGTAPCALTGYPGVALVSAGPHHRELEVARTPQGFMGGLSPSARANPVVRLAPGRTASALLEGQDVNQPSGAPCPHYAAVLVTPPNQRVTVRFRRALTICDTEIHPVVPGTSGTQRR